MAETFGNENIEAVAWNTGWQINACKFTSGSAGFLQKLSCYIKQSGASTSDVKMCLYDAALNKVVNGETEELFINHGQDGWMHFNFLTPPEVAAATDYWLAWWCDVVGSIFHNGGSPNQTSATFQAYNGWPAAINAGSIAWELSMYATYIVANNPPTAPTGQQVDGQSFPTGANCISDLTPGLSAIFNDPDAGDQANAIQIQVGTASGFSDMWDSGWLADATIAGNQCTAKIYAGATLLAGTSYWWRCRFRDDDNLVGAWSAWQQFDICAGRTGSGTEATGIGSSGLGCEPGGSLPKRLAFVCPRKNPRKEPAYRFPICA